jgi:NifU-like protein involved in Fe-S cluster formation
MGASSSITNDAAINKTLEEANNKLNNINKKARCGTPERACKPKTD